MIGARQLVIAAGLAVALAAGAGTAQATQALFTEVEESLTCQCGCGLTVHSCNHLQCGSALPLRDEIRAQIAEGRDKVAILSHFQEKYGEKILSSPTKSGFNLVAWVTPFFLVICGGLLVVVTVRRWGRRRAEPEPMSPARPSSAVPAAPSEYERILERELRDLDK